MKKHKCLLITLAICVYLFGQTAFISAAAAFEITGVTYDDTDGEVTVEGVADCRMVIVELWDATNNMLLSFISSAIEDNEFTAIIRTSGLQNGEYIVKAADYMGGSYISSSFSVPWEQPQEDTPAPSGSPEPEGTCGPSPTSKPAALPKITGNTIKITSAPGSGTTAGAEIDSRTIMQAIENSSADENGVRNIKIVIEPSMEANAYDVQLPAKILTSDAKGLNMNIITPIATLSIPDNMFSGSGLSEGQHVTLNVSAADREAIPDELAEAIGDRPVIALSAAVDGNIAEWNNPDAPVTVSIPYIPSAGELADTEYLTVWYIDGNGNLHSVSNAKYDPDSGLVVFTVTHFSRYAVVYVRASYNDMAGYGWAEKQVNVLASKGILKGISDGAFAPGEKVTRGDFVTWLVKALSLNAVFSDNFNDISISDECREELGIAKKLGIALGKGNNKYYPDEDIIRQDMMALAERALKVLKINLPEGTNDDLRKFNDAADIAGHARISAAALVRAGLIVGSGGNLNPAGTATRSEAAVLIYRLYNYTG